MTSETRLTAVCDRKYSSTRPKTALMNTSTLPCIPLKANSCPMLSSLLITKKLPNPSSRTPPMRLTCCVKVPVIMPIWIVLKFKLARRPNRLCNSSQNWGAALVDFITNAPLKVSTKTPWFSDDKTKRLRVALRNLGRNGTTDRVMNRPMMTTAIVSFQL